MTLASGGITLALELPRIMVGAVVVLGEALTGRSQSTEPGDRLYRLDPR